MAKTKEMLDASLSAKAENLRRKCKYILDTSACGSHWFGISSCQYNAEKCIEAAKLGSKELRVVRDQNRARTARKDGARMAIQYIGISENYAQQAISLLGDYAYKSIKRNSTR